MVPVPLTPRGKQTRSGCVATRASFSLFHVEEREKQQRQWRQMGGAVPLLVLPAALQQRSLVYAYWESNEQKCHIGFCLLQKHSGS